MKKEIPLTIRDVNFQGQGVALSPDGKVIFVDGGLPGEKVAAVLDQEKKNYSLGRIIAIEEPSSDRIKARCPWFGLCGGCQLQHASYSLQLKIKKNLVMESMKRIGQISHIDIDEVECVPSPEVWGYRNKGSFPVRANSPHKVGFFKRGSHTLVPIDACPILAPHLETFYISLKDELLRRFKGLPGVFYDESSGKGLLRHVILRGNQKEEILALAVVTSFKEKKTLTKIQGLLKDMKEKYGSFVSGAFNLNCSKGNGIVGGKSLSLWGDNLLSESLGGLDISYSGTAFFQVNTRQAERLFCYASDLAQSGGRVVELYAGAGALTSFLSLKSRSVLAIEEWKPSADMLKKNMELLGIQNVRALTGRAEDLTKALLDEKPHAIVLDPPRAGCAKDVLDGMDASSSDKIVYISCNPPTLARDVGYLSKKGWSIKSLRCFDMFPQTCHVETVCLLSRPKA